MESSTLPSLSMESHVHFLTLFPFVKFVVLIIADYDRSVLEPFSQAISYLHQQNPHNMSRLKGIKIGRVDGEDEHEPFANLLPIPIQLQEIVLSCSTEPNIWKKLETTITFHAQTLTYVEIFFPKYWKYWHFQKHSLELPFMPALQTLAFVTVGCNSRTGDDLFNLKPLLQVNISYSFFDERMG